MDKRQADVIKIAKGLCVFLVVLGHTMIPSIREENAGVYGLWEIIYVFHMPLFFAVSGLLYELNRDRYERAPGQFIKNKCRLLIVPYITVSIAVYLVLAVLGIVPGISSLIERYVHKVNSIGGAVCEIITYQNHVAQHLWFVLVLFFVFCINIVCRKANQKWLCVILALVPVFALPLLKMAVPVADIPNYLLFELPFFMLGRLIAQNKRFLEKATQPNYTPVIFAVLAWLYICYVNRTDNLLLPIRWVFLFVMRCMGVLMVFSISALIEKLPKAKEPLEFLERKSYPIYLLHQPFVVSGGAGVLYAMEVPVPLIIAAVTALGIAVPLIADKVFGNWKVYRLLILGDRK